MFKISGLDHIVLRTANNEAMLNFYVNILGCQIERVNHAISLTHLRIGNNMIDLLQVENPPSGKRNLEHFCLRITPFNYDNLNAYFQNHNIELLRYGNHFSALGMGHSFYINDPDGNEIEFIEDKKN